MAAPQTQPPEPGAEEVAAIGAIANPIIRNLRITECYHRLSLAGARRLGESANWCTFATWASKQAGRTIRGEDLLEKLAAQTRSGWTLLHPIRSLWRALLRRGILYPDTALGRLVHEINSPFDAFERASDAVARGNLKVFAEIGREFARYFAECREKTPPDSAQFQSFVDALRPGDPPDGQQYLRSAFRRYQLVRSEPGNPVNPQRLFLANLEIGFHEQTRLQPEIQESMESGPVTAEDLGDRARRVLFPVTHRLARGLRRAFAKLLGIPAGSFRKFVREATRRVVTESLMVLALPGGLTVALARNLEQPPAEALREITDADLLAFLCRCEPVAGAPDNCGAQDWAGLTQRMHFIAHLFRAFHERRSMFETPFAPPQVTAIYAGRIPENSL